MNQKGKKWWETITWWDLLWLLSYPIVQILGTLRHEGGHAFFAWIQGIPIEKMNLLPSKDLGRFTWGYVIAKPGYSFNTLVDIAPSILAVISFVLAYILIARAQLRRWLWMILFILFIVSPWVDTFYNFWGIFSPKADFGKMASTTPGLVLTLLWALPALGIGGYLMVRMYGLGIGQSRT